MKYTKKFAVALVATSLLVACAPPSGIPGGGTDQTETSLETTKIAVETQQAVRGALALDGEFLGTIMPGETKNIVSPVMGIVESVFIEEGDYVREGDILFRLDDDTAQSQLDRAIVSYESSIISRDQGIFNANSSLRNAELAYNQLLITQAQSIFNADNSVGSAEDNIARLEIAREQAIKQGNDAIDNARATYEQTLASQEQTLGGTQDLSDMQINKVLDDLEKAIEEAEDSLDDLKDLSDDATDAYYDVENLIWDYEDDKTTLENKISAVQSALNLVTTYSENGEDFEDLLAIAERTSFRTTDQSVTVGPNLDAAAKAAIIKANSELEKVGLSARSVSLSTLDTLGRDLERLASNYAQAVASEDLLYQNHLKAEATYDAAKDSIADLEEELAYQEALADIRHGDVKEETQAILDQQLERARLSIEQAEKSLELTLANYDLQIEQAREAQETAETSGGYTEDTLDGQLLQSENNLQTSKDSIGILERVYDSQIENAYLGIESARLQLDQYTVESPGEGIVENITLVEDGMVSNSSIVLTISDYSTMEVVFYVGEKVKNELELNQPVTFELDGKYHEGRVNEINNFVDPSTKLFRITAVVNPEDSFSNGVTVRLTTGTFEEDQTIIVPYDAVIFSNGGAYVFTVEDGRAVRKEVEIGLFTEDSISIIQGLSEDEEVITTWSEGLRDGVEITRVGDK